MKAALIRGYRLSLYRPFKSLETLFRRALFSLLPTRFNGFQLFKVPTGRMLMPGKPVIASTIEQRQPPLTLDSFSHARFCELQAIGNGGSYARVLGGYATMIAAHLTPQGQLIDPYTQCFSDAFVNSNPLFRFRLSRMCMPIHHVQGRIASLSVECQENYYHWLFDALPKLEILRRAGLTATHYYVDTSRQFQKDSLMLLGIESAQCISNRSHPFICADELLLTNFPGAGVIPSWVISFLRKNLRDRVHARSPKRLFISRSDAGVRRVLNEEAIAPLLKQAGFVTIMPGQHTLTEQIALFKEAEIIVGPHGAGFSNLVFCPPHAKVLELLAPGIPCVCFWALANLLKLEYHCLNSDPSTEIHEDSGYNDICIDPNKFSQALNRLGVDI